MTDTTKPTRRALVVAMERAGAALANAVSTLCATPGPLSEHSREFANQLRREWDLAHGNWQQAGHLSGEGDPASAAPPSITLPVGFVSKEDWLKIIALGPIKAAAQLQVQPVAPEGQRECRHCGWLCAPNPAPSQRVASTAAAIDPRAPEAQPVANGSTALTDLRDAFSEASDYIVLSPAQAAKLCEAMSTPNAGAQPVASDERRLRRDVAEERDHEIYTLWWAEAKSDTFRDTEEQILSLDYFKAGHKAALVATQPAAAPADAILLKLCDQLDGMKRTMFNRPSTGQNYSYLVHEDMQAYVEHARAALAARDPATPRQADPLDQRGYMMTERHLSGYRLILGFDNLTKVQDAHMFLANRDYLGDGTNRRAAPSIPAQADADGGNAAFVTGKSNILFTWGDIPAQADDTVARPDLLEKLTYHAHERDDMSIDDLLQTLSKERYSKVRQRTHRQLELQMLALLAGQQIPAQAGVPDGVRTWHDAERVRIEAVHAYNAKLEAGKKFGFPGPDVSHEFKVMTDTGNAAHRLIRPMFDALTEYFAAAPSAPAAPVQPVAVAEDAVMEMELALYRDAYGTQAPSEAVIDVLDERRRQVEQEGWTHEHDDEHGNGEMAAAAACYALHTEPVGNVGDYLRFWPWAAAWWKPRDRRSNLVRAGALLIAEIERIDRAAPVQDGKTDSGTGA